MRRRGQSEERRRRVLKDDLSGGGKVDPRDGTPPPRSAEAYPASALQDQPRISDLLPRSAWTLLALGIGGASVIGGLLVGYHKLQPALHPQHAIFDLSGTGGLANWWAACLLGMVAIVAGVCYSLRRYKLTDYHGRYRLWLWTVALALLASVAATTHWHVVAGREMARWIPADISPHNPLWWLLPTVLVVGCLALRLWLEMRVSAAATWLGYLALVAYAVGGGAQLWQPVALAEPTWVMISAGCLLSGHLLWLLSCCGYARYVILEMQGLLPQRVSSRSRRQDQPPKHPLGRRHDAPHPTPPTPPRDSDLAPDSPGQRTRRLVEEAEEEAERLTHRHRRAHRKHRHRQRPDADELADTTPPASTPKKLTKAERKRLRKLKAQQREAA